VNAQDTRLAELDGRLLGLARSVEVHDQRLGGVEAVIGRLLRAIQPLRVLWRPFRSAGL
jgi:hypothetical protein